MPREGRIRSTTVENLVLAAILVAKKAILLVNAALGAMAAGMARAGSGAALSLAHGPMTATAREAAAEATPKAANAAGVETSTEKTKAAKTRIVRIRRIRNPRRADVSLLPAPTHDPRLIRQLLSY